MNNQQPNATPAATTIPSASPSTIAAPPSESIHEQRRRRIEEFQRDAVAGSNTAEAVIATANGGLLYMGLEMEQKITNLLAQHPDSFERILPMIDAHLRVMRQTDRFTHLRIQMQNQATKNR